MLNYGIKFCLRLFKIKNTLWKHKQTIKRFG
jgi:hypothetical protein